MLKDGSKINAGAGSKRLKDTKSKSSNREGKSKMLRANQKMSVHLSRTNDHWHILSPNRQPDLVLPELGVGFGIRHLPK